MNKKWRKLLSEGLLAAMLVGLCPASVSGASSDPSGLCRTGRTATESEIREKDEIEEKEKGAARSGEKRDFASGSEAKRYPAFFYEEDFEGITVSLKAGSGILPEGTTAEIRELDLYELETLKAEDPSAVSGKRINRGEKDGDGEQDGEKLAFAFDIKLFDADGKDLGNTWAQKGSIKVTFTGSRVDETKSEAKKVSIVHIADSGKEDVVQDTEMTKSNRRREGLSFEARHFSVYAVRAVQDRTLVDGAGFTFDRETGILTVTGDLPARTLQSAGNAPYATYKDQVRKLVIDTESDIGAFSFARFPEVELEIVNAGTIRADAFAYCGIKEAVRIVNCTKIVDWAFRSHSGKVSSIRIGSCHEMEGNAFNGFSATLKSAEIGNCNEMGKIFSGFTELKEVTIGSCGDVKAGTFSYSGKLETIKIATCSEIGMQRLDGLKTLEIGTCTKIGISQIYNGYTPLLEEIVIGTCDKISSGGFYGASSLKKLKIGACDEIEGSAFLGASVLTELEIGACRRIGRFAFSGAGDEGAGIPQLKLEDVLLDENAFAHSKIDTVILKNNVQIGSQAFADSTIQHIVLSGVSSLGPEAFAYVTELKTLTIEDLNEISDASFRIEDHAVNAVEEIRLKNVEWIGNYAFNNFSNLKHVYVEGSCRYIGAHAFSGCGKLETIDISPKTRLGYSDSFVRVRDRERPDRNPVYDRVQAILRDQFQVINTDTPIREIRPDGWTSYQIGKENVTDRIGGTQLIKEAKWSDAEKTVAEVQIKAYYTLNKQMDFVMVADCSNSMSDFGSGDTMESNFYNMQSKMMDVTKKLLSDRSTLDTRVAFATFGEKEETDCKVSEFFEKGQTDAAESYIWKDIVNYQSNTNYSIGLKKAMERVLENQKAGRRTAVIFISDGQPYYNEKIEDIPESYYGVEEANALKKAGAQLFTVLQQVEEKDLDRSEANMLKLTGDPSKCFSSTDLKSFSEAMNHAIDYAYTTFTLTDTVNQAQFELDESSIEASGGEVSVGTNERGEKVLTWRLGLSLKHPAEPFTEYTLRFKENLKKEADGSHPYGTFDTNIGYALLDNGTEAVNGVSTPQLPREKTEQPKPKPDPDPKTAKLQIEKTVNGTGSSKKRSFPFELYLTNQTKLNGTYGDLRFNGGKARFTLKHGERKTVSGLPDGTEFTIKESAAASYTPSVEELDENGKILNSSSGEHTYSSVLSAERGTVRIRYRNNYKGSGGNKGSTGSSSSGSSGSGKKVPGQTVPGKSVHPEPAAPVIPEGQTPGSSASPHPEINRLPVMGVPGPAEAITAQNNTAQTADAGTVGSGGTARREDVKNVIAPLAAQHAQNNDLGGWLTVPGTGGGYPVMYSPYSWEYYLHHGFDRKSSRVGVPFMGEATEIGGDNTLIHGHNMNGELQFGWIWNYQFQDFRAKHPTIDFKTIYDGDGQYEVMSIFFSPVYPAEQTNVFKWYQYVGKLSKAQFDYYVQNAKASSLYDTGVTAEYGDRLITLETCASYTTNERLVVVARKKTVK